MSNKQKLYCIRITRSQRSKPNSRHKVIICYHLKSDNTLSQYRVPNILVLFYHASSSLLRSTTLAYYMMIRWLKSIFLLKRRSCTKIGNPDGQRYSKKEEVPHIADTDLSMVMIVSSIDKNPYEMPHMRQISSKSSMSDEIRLSGIHRPEMDVQDNKDPIVFSNYVAILVRSS